jgi:hypothetical protein
MFSVGSANTVQCKERVAMFLRRNMRVICVCACVIVLLCGVPWASAANVNLAWDASVSTGVTGYRFYIGTAPGVYTTNINVGNVLLYTALNLTPGQRYYFSVTAYDVSNQQSAYATELAYTVPLPIPSAPTNLRVQ